jgi:hypothetical protein
MRRELPEGSRRLTFWETAPPGVRIEICIEVNAHEVPRDLDPETIAFQWGEKLQHPLQQLIAGWTKWAGGRSAPKPN